ncbi:MAG: ABC transporter ATP-binding protein [Sciscionella sp.]
MKAKAATEFLGNRHGADAPPRTIVECEDAARTYGSGRTAVVAVHGARCRVLPGMRVAVTGPSGSGKSTLLHLMAGLESPTAGTVSWPGLDGSPQGRPGTVGVVFQGPSLLPALDVTENIALPLLVSGESQDAALDRALTAMRRLGISELVGKLPDELSGGQAQRVAVARVLASRPVLILADEPTGQLDHVSADRVITVLLAAADELGAALVISTHDEMIASRLPVRWEMRDGRLLPATTANED